MCYFYGGNLANVEYVQLADITLNLNLFRNELNNLDPVMDGFRYINAPIIIAAANGPEIISAHWEFIPTWINNMEALADARKKGIPWLNATSEKLLESKMFRNAALKRRCLVLASWFFEWRKFKPEGASKDTSYPYAIGVKRKEYFFFAGIWQPWTDKSSGETLNTFAIITTKANPVMEAIHNSKKRMPTILPNELAFEWVASDIPEDRINEMASVKLDSEKLWYHPIRKDFKILDQPLEAFTYPELPAI